MKGIECEESVSALRNFAGVLESYEKRGMGAGKEGWRGLMENPRPTVRGREKKFNLKWSYRGKGGWAQFQEQRIFTGFRGPG